MSIGTPRVDALVDLLCFARRSGIPIQFLEYVGAGNTFGRLTALVSNPNRYPKCDLDGFSNLKFRRDMATLRDDHTLIVGGYNYSACVFRTVETAIKLGFSVLTSPDLLFYSRDSSSRFPDCEGWATEFYNSNVSIAPDARAIMNLVSRPQ